MPEEFRRLRKGPPAKPRRHAVAVPGLGELPNLRQGQHVPARCARRRAPAIYILLRPEECDGRSSVDKIVVPPPEGQGEMGHASGRIDELTTPDRVRRNLA